MKRTCLVTALALGTFCIAALSAQASHEVGFTFKTPRKFSVTIPDTAFRAAMPGIKTDWLRAHPADEPETTLELGSRIVVQLTNTNTLDSILAGGVLEPARVVGSNIFILQAPDAWAAAAAAHQLAARHEVQACYPVMRRPVDLRGPYALRSNDPYFCPYFYTSGNQYVEGQWPLENRDMDGKALGFDLNVLAAWPYTRGEGVTVAVADSGLDFVHPELTNRLAGAPHFNFNTRDTNAAPFGGGTTDPLKAFWTHGTSVAGLIAAEADNNRGMAGVAPLARLASWVIFTTNALLVDDERLMDMYMYASNIVGVQNHSWGTGSGKRQAGPTLLEQIGIYNATLLGRNGLGTVMVRAGGNDRASLARADDDGYVSDPNVIAVGAVARSGRATDYSEPGACLLVAAPGGGSGYQGLLTLDLQGSERGVNSGIYYFNDYADYRTGAWLGFVGTSGAAPFVSGIAALMLSANPQLSYRDVQQILVLASRQVDPADPDIVTNAAGFAVSHNAGFGVPDAGHAVWLARQWSNRPPLTTVTMTLTQPAEIPDDGLRVMVSGPGVPPELRSIRCMPGAGGPHPDAPTPALPLVYIGLATNVPPINLTNKGALILRGQADFSVKINNAAAAGAAFAIIYNNDPVNDGLIAMLGTDYVPIPAVFISNADGEALKALFETNQVARAQLRLHSTNIHFDIQAPVICEFVGVRLNIEHPVRGDLRITLVSPAGTRSVFAHYNDDTNAFGPDWAYWSTHHFFEPGAGRWTLCVGDESAGGTGVVRSASLILRGVQITDADRDGLDDVWEQAKIGHLAFGPRDDPDNDGFSNAREQLMGTEPLQCDRALQLDLSFWTLWGVKLARLSWPSVPGATYDVYSTTNLGTGMVLVTNVTGRFWETEFYSPASDAPQRFFRVTKRLGH
ncbi:MAG: S8 family serine peptidase [Verrucomicrobiae bacterium]|nr:S8 family serine peptidase [Verrucomicrobiae bacterium]MDW7978945.1 S8 family serine peptidase [Verrucomicrobiales bacterium]